MKLDFVDYFLLFAIILGTASMIYWYWNWKDTMSIRSAIGAAACASVFLIRNFPKNKGERT